VRLARLALIVLAAAACAPASASALTTDPPLQPKFKAGIKDYAVRCPDRSVAISGDGYDGPASVPIQPGQAIRFEVQSGGETKRHFARCLPDDFPTWFYRKNGPQEHRWFLMTPGVSFANPVKPFVVIFDRYGAPLWWYRSPSGQAHDARLIDGNIAYAEAPPGGTLTRPSLPSLKPRRSIAPSICAFPATKIAIAASSPSSTDSVRFAGIENADTQ